ncbi:MAG: ABC transporter ATP-binding protein [Clostridia bacterium]|nr:ABC transporter ATP-binding protein [Clostridia bacterium]
MCMSTPITSLRIDHITKRFPGIVACSDISLSVGKGEVLALVGENGAGKTTLMNILMGLYTPDEGKIYINNKEVVFKSPSDAFACGIGMVHQQYMLVPNLTVTENIALGLSQMKTEQAGNHTLERLKKAAKLDLDAVRRHIIAISEHYGLAVDPDAYIWQLSVGEQQRVELVKTLCFGAKFLILDEPTSALTPQETDELIALLKRMSNELSIIFISHKLAEVKALSNKVAILRGGKLVFRGNTADHSAADIAALMTGHEVYLPTNQSKRQPGKPMLEVHNLFVRGDRGNMVLNKLNLTVRAGEIVGLAGVSGNGQRELAESLTGLRVIESGEVLLDGVSLVGKSPKQIIAQGMGYVPEERNVEGIVPSMSIRENLVLKDIAKSPFSLGGTLINNKKIDENANALREKFDIRCSSVNVAAGSLSGGNIQKVILAREINRGPKFLIAVYPIRGLDLGAAEFIHKQLLALRDSGVGILLISEELEEIINLSDRIAVIFKGQIQRTLGHGEATQRKLGMMMAGVKEV